MLAPLPCAEPQHAPCGQERSAIDGSCFLAVGVFIGMLLTWYWMLFCFHVGSHVYVVGEAQGFLYFVLVGLHDLL